MRRAANERRRAGEHGRLKRNQRGMEKEMNGEMSGGWEVGARDGGAHRSITRFQKTRRANAQLMTVGGRAKVERTREVQRTERGFEKERKGRDERLARTQERIQRQNDHAIAITATIPEIFVIMKREKVEQRADYTFASRFCAFPPRRYRGARATTRVFAPSPIPPPVPPHMLQNRRGKRHFDQNARTDATVRTLVRQGRRPQERCAPDKARAQHFPGRERKERERPQRKKKWPRG